MAKSKGEPVKWITVKGRRVPIYKDGSMGGFMEGKKATKKEHADEYDKKEEKSGKKWMEDIDDQRLEEIADRYNTSKPVSGSWDTETEHGQKAIAREFDLTMDEAKQVMKERLGFDEEQFRKKPPAELGETEMPIDVDRTKEKDRRDKVRALEEAKAKEEGFASVEAMKSYYEEVGGDDDDDFPFQSKEPTREERAENWNKGEKETKPSIKDMGYAEAGAYMAEHKEEFGLSEDDDAYQIAAQVKNGDIKLDSNGKVPKQDRADVKAWNEKMNRENSIDDYEGPDKDSYSKTDKPHKVTVERQGEKVQFDSYGEGWEEGYHVEHTDYVGGKYIDQGKVGDYEVGEKVNYKYADSDKPKPGTIMMAHKYPNGKVDYTVVDDKDGDGHSIYASNLSKQGDKSIKVGNKTVGVTNNKADAILSKATVGGKVRLTRLNANELRELAVSLGVDKKELYGTSLDTLRFKVGQLMKKK